VSVVAASPIRTDSHASSGPPWSLIIGAALLVLLGGATALAVRRRHTAAR
jgi:MYXO-CTERM domain-containing protein